METITSDIIQTSIDTFVTFSRKITESAKLITEHLEITGWQIEELLELSEKLDERLKQVYEENIKQRNQNSIVQSMCENLKNNIIKQGELLPDLKLDKPESENTLTEIKEMNLAFLEAIDQVLDTVNKIISEQNKIILMDKFIETRKRYQIKSIKILKKLAELSLENVRQTINDSRSCLNSGLHIASALKEADMVSPDEKGELNNLIVSSNKNWNMAIEINKIAETQREFVEKVNAYLQKLLEDVDIIKEKVKNKHHLYEENLQSVTVLTVLISIKFKRYLKIENIFENSDSNSEKLFTFIKIACDDIRELNKLNYDMADNSHYNNEIETETVKSSEIENESYVKLQKAVDEILELSKTQLNNSNNAITIGMKIEKILKDAVFNMEE